MLTQTLITVTIGLSTLSTFSAMAPAPAQEAGVLSIRMSGFRSAAGQVLIAIYRGADGFPGEPGKAWKTAVVKIAGDQAKFDVPAPPGEYAFSIVHDENGNNKLDTSWIGIPQEGFGTSNNAKGRFGPPKYRDAKFSVGEAGAIQRISVVYL